LTDEPNDATPWLPERPSLKALREAAAGCQGCHLHRHATQTVFGEGKAGSRIMFVGEMAGDREDREGRPFVGPAGRELVAALEEVGIDRAEAYVTNVVKHFSFTERGRRRIHQTPKRFEVEACRPWLEAELRVVNPDVLVTLGATAGKALFGTKFRVTEERGRPIESDLAPLVTATVHPSSILRQQTEEDRSAERHAFVEDLRVVAEQLA
jgi:uracil-DNA glycosylase